MTDMTASLLMGPAENFLREEEAAALNEVVMGVFHPAADPEISNSGRKGKGRVGSVEGAKKFFF